MSSQLMLLALIVVGYYMLVLVYVLGIQMHLSVPRMTEKFIITDQQRRWMVLLQFCLTLAVSWFLGSAELLVLGITALILSVSLFAITEVLGLVSIVSIAFQFIGFVIPAIVPGLFGYLLSLGIFIASIDDKDSAWHIRRYDRHIMRLHRRCKKRFSQYFISESRYIRDVAMAILLVECLARPRVFRLLERLAKVTVYRSQSMSTGIMQVIAPFQLSDGESIVRGIVYIKKLNAKFIRQGWKDEYSRAKKIASAYNGDDEYGEYFSVIYGYVRDGVFPNPLQQDIRSS